MACMEPEFFSIVKSETGEEVDSGIIHDYDWSTGNDYDWSTGNDRGIVTEGAIEDVHMDIEPPLSLEVYEEESSVDCSFDHEHEENTVDDPSEKEPLESSLAVPILSSSGPIQDPTFVEVFKYGWTGNGRGDGNPNKQDQIPGVSAIQEQQVTIKEEPSYVEDGEAKETNLIKIEPLSEKETQTGVVSMINSECHRWKSIPISPNTKYSEIVLDSSVVPLTPSNNVEPSVLQMKYIFGNQMTMLNKFQLNSGHTVKQYVMNEFCSDLPIQQPVAAAQDASTSCIDERIAKRLAGPSWHSKYSCGGCTFCEKYKTGKCIVLHKGKKKGSSKNGVHKDHKHNKTDKGISRNVSHINGVKKQVHMETPYEQKLNSNKNKLFKFRELMPKNVMELKKQLTSFTYWNLNLMKKAPVAKNLSLPSNILGQVCKECQSQIKSAYHYSSFLMKCRKCRYKSYCIGAYVHHKYRKKAPLSRDATGKKSQLECACGLITESGREMANHLCCDECEYDQKSCKVYNTVQSSIDNDTDCVVIDDNDDEIIPVLDTSFVDVEAVEDSDDCIIIDEIPSQQKSDVPQPNQDQHCRPLTSTNKTTVVSDGSVDNMTNSLLSLKPHEDANLKSLNSNSFINILDASSRIRTVVTTNINPCTTEKAEFVLQTESETAIDDSVSKEAVHSNFYGEILEKVNTQLGSLENVYQDHDYIFKSVFELLENKLKLDLKNLSSFMSSEEKLRHKILGYSIRNENRCQTISTDNKPSESDKGKKDRLYVIQNKRKKQKTSETEHFGEVTYFGGNNVVYRNAPKTGCRLDQRVHDAPSLQSAFNDDALSLWTTSYDDPPSLRPAISDDPPLSLYDSSPSLRSALNDHPDSDESEKQYQKKKLRDNASSSYGNKNTRSCSHHNFLEKKRRVEFSNLFNALLCQVWHCDSSEISRVPSKIYVLKSAIKVIEELTSSSNQLEQQKQHLYAQNHQLQHMLQLLK